MYIFLTTINKVNTIYSIYDIIIITYIASNARSTPIWDLNV